VRRVGGGGPDTIRPPASSNTRAPRAPRRLASSSLFVASTIAVPAACTSNSSARMSFADFRVELARRLVGDEHQRADSRSPRAIAARCFCPAESFARKRMRPRRPRARRARAHFLDAAVQRGPVPPPCVRRTSAMFSNRLRSSSSLKSSKTTPSVRRSCARWPRLEPPGNKTPHLDLAFGGELLPSSTGGATSSCRRRSGRDDAELAFAHFPVEIGRACSAA
jgi:hypothetical protein